MRNPAVKLWIFAAVLMIVGVALSSSRAVEIFGVRPNLFFAVIVSAGFFTESILAYLGLVLFGTLLLRSGMGLDVSALNAGFIALLAFWARRNIFSPGPVANLIFIGLATLIWNLSMAPAFVFKNPGTLALELFYNLAAGAVVYGLLSLVKARAEQRNY